MAEVNGLASRREAATTRRPLREELLRYRQESTSFKNLPARIFGLAFMNMRLPSIPGRTALFEGSHRPFVSCTGLSDGSFSTARATSDSISVAHALRSKKGRNDFEIGSTSFVSERCVLQSAVHSCIRQSGISQLL